MRMMVLAACLAAALAPGALHAQAMVRADSLTLAAMKRLEFMIGEWQGEATVQMGPQNSSTSRVRESAQWRLDGAGILVQGHGTAQVQPGGPEVTVHDALAVISYDKTNQHYRMQAWRGDGEPIDATIEVGDRRVVWGFQDPRGFTVRFTIQFTAEGRWNEVGEVTRDGQTWCPPRGASRRVSRRQTAGWIFPGRGPVQGSPTAPWTPNVKGRKGLATFRGETLDWMPRCFRRPTRSPCFP